MVQKMVNYGGYRFSQKIDAKKDMLIIYFTLAIYFLSFSSQQHDIKKSISSDRKPRKLPQYQKRLSTRKLQLEKCTDLIDITRCSV